MKRITKFIALALFGTSFYSCSINEDLDSGAALSEYDESIHQFATFEEYENFISNESTPHQLPESPKNFKSFRLAPDDRFKEVDFFKILNEDGIFSIANYLVKVDFAKEIVTVVDKKHGPLQLVNSDYDDENVLLFSFYDDVLDYLEEGKKGTIQSVDKIKSYNDQKREELARKVDRTTKQQKYNASNASLSAFVFPSSNDPSSVNTFTDLVQAPFGVASGCSPTARWTIPHPMNNTIHDRRFVDITNCNGQYYYTYATITYLTAGVYFELKVDLDHFAPGNNNNPSLYMNSNFYYERRRRLGSNEHVYDSRSATGSNTNHLGYFIYSGSRSLANWWIDSHFVYNYLVPGSTITQRRIHTSPVYRENVFKPIL